MRRAQTLCLVVTTGIASFASVGHAQVMPSPEDFAITPWDRKFERGPCDFASSEDDLAIYSIQEAYERAGRCAEYGQTFDRAGNKVVWMNYLWEADAPHTFQGFFAHYDLSWWDGYVPPRVRGTQYDSGTGNRAAVSDLSPGGSPDGAACGASAPDELAVRLQGFLSANDMCTIYTPERYDAFKHEVPSEQHYAVNYVAWIAGEPLLPADQAAALDAQYLGEASFVPTTPPGTAELPRIADAAARPSDSGTCGFPVRTPEQASGQDILAKMGRCDEYQGARE